MMSPCRVSESGSKAEHHMLLIPHEGFTLPNMPDAYPRRRPPLRPLTTKGNAGNFLQRKFRQAGGGGTGKTNGGRKYEKRLLGEKKGKGQRNGTNAGAQIKPKSHTTA